jgi:hypothetical protein
MSKVSIQGDASGTGTLTIAAPNTNSNYTLTLPTNTGTVMTSASDTFAGGLTLGGDLTLDSNGIYLGGTGAANYLDDYEEGTWTPVFEATTTNFTSVTYNGAQHKGYYVKVGNIVHITMFTRIDAFSGGSGNVQITGLPFTVGSTGSSGTGAAGYAQHWNSSFSVHVSTSSNIIYLFKDGLFTTRVTVTDMRNSNDSNQIPLSLSYRVD